MASSVNLRGSALLNKSPYDDYRIIHHWEAEDWTEGTDWIDRVGGLAFTRVGNPIKANGMIGCCYDKGYFYLDANAAAPNGIDMGSLWIVEVEFMFEYHSNITGNRGYTAVDFGSNTLAAHAFIFNVNGSSKVVGFNAKLDGNDSASLYNQTFDFQSYFGKVVKAAMGTKEVDSNTVLPFYIFQNEIKYSPNTITKEKASFNRNFNRSEITIAVPNNAHVNHNLSWDSAPYYKYIKSIKIYSHLSETTTISISQRGGDDSVLTGLPVKVTDTYNGNILYQGTWDGNDITLKIFDRVNYTVEVGTVIDYWVLSTKRQYTAVGGINKTISFEFLYKSVDLGLPSGRIWSRGSLVKDANGQYDIGEPMDVGTYHSWANIDGYNKGESYSFTQAAYDNTHGATLTGNIPSDSAEYDICCARLGAPWHIPSATDARELNSNTDKELIEIDGINVLKLMKKTDHNVYILMPYYGSFYNQFYNSRYICHNSNTVGDSASFICIAENSGLIVTGSQKASGALARPVM